MRNDNGTPSRHAAQRWRMRPEQAGELIAVLSKAQGLSRRAAKRLLDERRVFVNGRRVWMARHALRPGDVVEVQPPGALAADTLAVLAEAEPYLIVDKPAGCTTNEDGRSVEARLRRRRNEDDWTAVHRLDRDTSGCLLFARTPEAARRLIPLFRERRVEKVYWAIVLGAFPASLRRIAAPIAGEPAVTRLRVLARGNGASLLEARIETGRTHQIRRHLWQVGHPVAGDRTYGTSRALDERSRALPRQMLHARRLAFTHPDTGRLVAAESPAPADFRAALRSYQLRAPV